MSSFRNLNAKVLGISTDTFFALKAWDDQQKLGFPLLSDYNKEAIKKYGVVNPDMIGLKNIAKRAVFVIDKGGVVRYREVLEDARNEPDYGKLNAGSLTTLANKPVVVRRLRNPRGVGLQDRRHGLPRGSGDPRAPAEASARARGSRRRSRRAAASRALRRREAVDLRHRRGCRADRHARVARARTAGRTHRRGDHAPGARRRFRRGACRRPAARVRSPLQLSARARLLSAVDSDRRHLHRPPRLGRHAGDVAGHQRADARRGCRRDRDRRVVGRRDGDVPVCVCADSRGAQHGSRAERDSRADGSDAARGGRAPRRPGDAGRRRRRAASRKFCS